MDSSLQQKLETLPTTAGVYVMKDRFGEVVYVGKAVNLRSRVRSYFTRTGDGRAFIPLLEQLLGDIETVMVSGEKEALLLENELIKQHQPRFNVKLRDDKNYICLRLDIAHPFPRLEVVRNFHNDGAKYFGPYSSATSIRETLRIINRYFQLRTCSDHVLQNRKRPCLLYQIGRCPAPCVKEVSSEEYRRNVDETALFLDGKGSELLDSLRGRMNDMADQLRYEEAARLRDQLIAIERSLERQKIAIVDRVDQDVFGHYREADRLMIYVLYVRQGRLSGGQGFYFTGQEFPDEELLGSFVNLYYASENLIPEQVLLPVEPEGLEALEDLLTERKGTKVRVLVPKRGEKLELVAMAVKNAEQSFIERRRTKDETLVILERLQKKLSLSRIPHRMECFDISHFQGSAVVASQVASVDGEADKSGYRRFRIKTVAGNDDFASMYEVISRRVKRGLLEKNLPDLLVIDGGKGQLASAMAALKDQNVEGVDVVGLAKSRDLDDSGFIRRKSAVRRPPAASADDSTTASSSDETSAKSPERVFVPNRKDPIVLPQTSPELFMLTRLRDEAHRFAITFQKKVLRQKNLTSVLEDIPGVGDGRKKALLRHFGSLKRISAATIEELQEVEGLGASVAERIHAFLHGQDGALAQAETAQDTVREASLEDAGI